jgi:hypothetical protein
MLQKYLKSFKVKIAHAQRRERTFASLTWINVCYFWKLYGQEKLSMFAHYFYK